MKSSTYFDKPAADKAVKFINGLRHTKGRWAGVPFRLRPWQEKIIRDVFGWKNADGTRQYRYLYIEIPRGNGKSELCAAIALYLLFADREPGAEIYGAACDRDQASIVFNVAAAMVRQHPKLRRRCKIVESTKRIIVVKTGSFYRAIPADAAGGHGFNAHGIVFDELHNQKNRDLWDALTSGQGKREQPLVVAITTAGTDRQSICWEQHNYARQVLDGTVSDPTFYGVIYAADEKDEWRSVKTWKKCNPALGDFLSLPYLRSELQKATAMPGRENTFKRFYLNIWTQQVSRWLSLEKWNAQGGIISEEKLKGWTCYGGLDLGAVDDLTAWVMLFPNPKDPDEIGVVTRFWCPDARLRDSQNQYRDSYRVWARQGWLKTTPGEATDYAFVKAQILKDAATFRLVDMNVDRLFQAHQLASELSDEGLKVIGMGMSFMALAAPVREFERRFLAGKIRHGGNPILAWMVNNVAVKQDPNGNLKPDKAASQGKIDGIVALIMAVDRLMRRDTSRSVYEDRGVRHV